MSASLTLLYVDDDPDIRMIVEIALGLDPTIVLRTAGSGGEALALAVDPAFCPDALVLDVMMPGLDGIATLRALRTLPTLARKPALFMTARGRDADMTRYRAEGVVGVILKPFDPVLLAGKIRALLMPARRLPMVRPAA